MVQIWRKWKSVSHIYSKLQVENFRYYVQMSVCYILGPHPHPEPMMKYEVMFKKYILHFWVKNNTMISSYNF